MLMSKKSIECMLYCRVKLIIGCPVLRKSTKSQSCWGEPGQRRKNVVYVAHPEKWSRKPGGGPAEEILLHIRHEQVGKRGGHPGSHGHSPDLFVCACIKLKNVVV